jgi:hypothetical protein
MEMEKKSNRKIISVDEEKDILGNPGGHAASLSPCCCKIEKIYRKNLYVKPISWLPGNSD